MSMLEAVAALQRIILTDPSRHSIPSDATRLSSHGHQGSPSAYSGTQHTQALAAAPRSDYAQPATIPQGDDIPNAPVFSQSTTLYGSNLYSQQPSAFTGHPSGGSLLTQPVDQSVMGVHTKVLQWIDSVHRSAYQAYTFVNDCLNPNCMCGVGCTCQGCCAHSGHTDLPGSTGLFFEGGPVEYNPPGAHTERPDTEGAPEPHVGGHTEASLALYGALPSILFLLK